MLVETLYPGDEAYLSAILQCTALILKIFHFLFYLLRMLKYTMIFSLRRTGNSWLWFKVILVVFV
jgi:hypothetical protein